MDDASEAATRALAEIDWIRDRVIHVVGHALRTPVTTLCGMARSLAETDDPALRHELAGGVVRNAEKLERLLDRLLVAAEVSTVFPVGDPESIDVAGAVKVAWDDLEPAATLTLHGAATVHARGRSVDQILRCLLDNAAKYGDGKVTVNLAQGDATATIDVESRGAVPTDDEMAHAFELFVRGEHAVTSEAGLGTGLPVARRLARLEGGEVTLHRQGGTVVARVVLPA